MHADKLAHNFATPKEVPDNAHHKSRLGADCPFDSHWEWIPPFIEESVDYSAQQPLQ